MSDDDLHALRLDANFGESPLRAELRALRVENERLRSLPVLRTCGDCGWRTVPATSGVRYCGHPRASDDLTAPLDDPPPHACPLRAIS